MKYEFMYNPELQEIYIGSRHSSFGLVFRGGAKFKDGKFVDHLRAVYPNGEGPDIETTTKSEWKIFSPKKWEEILKTKPI